MKKKPAEIYPFLYFVQLQIEFLFQLYSKLWHYAEKNMDKSCWTHILIILLYVWNAFTFTTSYCRKLILTSASLQFLQGRCPRYHLQWCLLLHLILKVSSHSKNYTCVYSTINMIKDKTTKEFVYFTQINNFMISWHHIKLTIVAWG